MNVLINGAESTGVRMARLLASLGMQVSLGKHSICPDDPQTREILIMKEEFGPIQVYLTGHIDLESRLVEARRWGINAIPMQEAFTRGPDKFPDAVIDCSSKEEAAWNLTHIYNTPSYTPHLLPGTIERRLSKTQFLSAPNSRSGMEICNYLMSDSRHAGQDSTACAMIIGTLLGTIEPQKIAGIDVGIRKSYSGPGERLPNPLRPTEYETSPFEKTEILESLPQLENKVRVRSNRNPWANYDRYDISIALRSPLSKEQQDGLNSAFSGHKRCIFTRYDLGGSAYDLATQGVNEVKRACAEIGLLESDSLLPTLSLDFPSQHSVLIRGYVPTRTGAALSSIDWLWVATGKADSLETACMKTDLVEWHGMNISKLKRRMEDILNRGYVHTQQAVEYKMAA